MAVSLKIRLRIREYDIKIKDLPSEAQNLVVAHLSDLHDRKRAGLVRAIEEKKPDLIFVTGDFMDYGRQNDISIGIASEIVKVAPVYYCPGNHEKESDDYEEMMLRLKSTGVNVLRDEQAYSHGMRIVGFEDVDKTEKRNRREFFKNSISKLESDEFSVALYHHANLLDLMEESKFELVFSGHVHGGQARIPGGRGIISPDVEFFPEYDGGVFVRKKSVFVVSRGLIFFAHMPRFFNPPELVFVTLRSQKQ